MKIVERFVIDVAPEKVWPWIVSPEKFREWNDKVLSMEAKGRFIVGQPFITHHVMSKKRVQSTATALRIEEGRLIELFYENCIGEKGAMEVQVTETIELQDKGGHTEVVKTVVFKNHGVPLILQPLIWFVTRFGKSTGPNRLKAICEAGTVL